MIKGFLKHFRVNISDIKIEWRFDDPMSSYRVGDACSTHGWTRFAEHKYSSIGKHLKEEYSLQPTTKPVYSSKLRNATQSLTV